MTLAAGVSIPMEQCGHVPPIYECPCQYLSVLVVHRFGRWTFIQAVVGSISAWGIVRAP